MEPDEPPGVVYLLTKDMGQKSEIMNNRVASSEVQTLCSPVRGQIRPVWNPT